MPSTRGLYDSFFPLLKTLITEITNFLPLLKTLIKEITKISLLSVKFFYFVENFRLAVGIIYPKIVKIKMFLKTKLRGSKVSEHRFILYNTTFTSMQILNSGYYAN